MKKNCKNSKNSRNAKNATSFFLAKNTKMAGMKNRQGKEDIKIQSSGPQIDFLQ